MRIRDATEDDLPAITAIQNALLATTTYEWTETPHTLDEKRAWFARQRASGWPVLVAVDEEASGGVGGDEGPVVGFAAYGDFRDSMSKPGYRFVVELTVHVTESHWGRGVGRALIRSLEDRARAAGKWVMVAGIDGSNVDSIEFHRRLGYVEVARMPGIGEKFGQRLDLVLMQRDLGPADSAADSE